MTSLDPAAEAAARRTLCTSDDPIAVFDAFVVLNIDPSLHAHFADNDDNDAERVRRVIRRAMMGPSPVIAGGGGRGGGMTIGVPLGVPMSTTSLSIGGGGGGTYSPGREGDV